MIEVSTVPEAANAIVKSRVDRAAYLAKLLKQRGEGESPLKELRDQAAAIAQEQAIPSTRDEEWRFTDLSHLLTIEFEPTEAAIQFDIPGELPNGVFVGPLAKFPGDVAALQPYLGKQQGSDEVFTALNTASLSQVAIVWVPKNIVVDAPISLTITSQPSDKATIAHPRCLVIAESGSSVTIVEDYRSPTSDHPHWTNAVTEIFLATNAQVNHTRVQRDAHSAYHIGKTAVSQARDSRYTCQALNFGAALSRHHLEVYQTGEQTETTLNGLSVVDGDRHTDTHSLIAFTQPHGTSNQVNKCIVGDRSHGVFNGKIFVPKKAQLTNAAQLSRNLLLSPKARIDTKPQLEITADNVKCAHGATVSQLEEDAVFYLQSRGISEAAAKALLTYAFAVEVIDAIPVAALRAELSTIVASLRMS